ncbi:MAG: helix-turn-helix domain-containing protein [Chloroflexi bacterium]|nr:helix-turn-helix domain-containing protein [Chloroflexota bacterium]
MNDSSVQYPSPWLSLTEASKLLGIHPSTLRSWVDAGLIPAFRTPGGHRRIGLAQIQAFLAEHGTAMMLQAPNAPAYQTLDQVRQEMASRPIGQQDWYNQLSSDDRAWYRSAGQRLLGLLLQFASRHENASHFLNESRVVGLEYGRRFAGAGMSVKELVRAFLYFRQMIVSAAYQPDDPVNQRDNEGIRLLQRINQFMDEVLLSTLDGYERGTPINHASAAKSCADQHATVEHLLPLPTEGDSEA